ncbi:MULTISPECIES: alpha/beta fold hydrolase [Pandoraea]|uniref:Alpha/beta hydrolase n=3 Tax=Pandoraea TaxID=93217 RepID=A0AAW7MH78_9BURK|nr:MULTISPECIES: alpha/beta hydrolase [Pandoraea]QHE94800.1 alpha/beta fold hydrolase [Pandoraea fibrosis]ALS67943.1 alpha/beta hydrolase [Pandoraea apista]MDN4572082.1 alpha/beta hydrolase [Pandoraea cepalis]MDN4576738.1 alpha/beta hydrolase [Pandoraea cepalis]QHF15926.1 alpha/beta fold hydrolase [Pandoraea fibrosis]
MDNVIRKTTFLGGTHNRLTADVGGNPASAPVLLLHGGGQTRHSWRQTQLELIAAGFFVVSLDARGHGDSEWIANADYSSDAQIQDIIAVAKAIGRPPALVGASMGGMNALMACGEHPGIASALVLVDVTPRLEMGGVDRIRAFMHANLDGFSTLDDAADAVAAYNPARPRPRNPDGLRKNLRQHQDGRWYWHWDPRIFADDPRTKLHGLAQRMLTAAERLRLPALLVRGGESDVVGQEGVDELRAHIPHLEYADIAGAGHMIAGDRNDAFTNTVVGFLGRHLLPVRRDAMLQPNAR